MQEERTLQTSCRPLLWGSHFDLAQYRVDDERAVLIHQLYLHLLSPAGAATLATLARLPSQKYTISVNCDELIAQSGIVQFEDALKAQPDVLLQCLSIAVGEVSWAAIQKGSRGVQHTNDLDTVTISGCVQAWLRSAADQGNGRASAGTSQHPAPQLAGLQCLAHVYVHLQPSNSSFVSRRVGGSVTAQDRM